MPVFISHRSVDKYSAKNIYNYLTIRDIKCYIDDLDPELKNTDDITSVIMTRISQCTHIMAIVSEYTQGSWWVPFEIGVASKADRRVTTYRLKYIELPQFLKKWPILKDQQDLEKFIRKYKEDALVPLHERRTYDAKAASIQTADQFHKELKSAIGQY
jgi:TIR domain